MSNYLAIATVTATLQRTLQAIVQSDVYGARVTTIRPDTVGSGAPETAVNLYLYHVVPNLAWRNADLRTRYSEGQFAKRPQAALDLFYLISCYGNEVELEPQRLLGSVVRTLHARPILTREMIRETLSDSTFTFLNDSNLSEQVDVVKFSPLSMSIEELSNIWSVFFQTPHALSIAYQAGVVLIESDDIPQRALPVRDRSKFSGAPFRSSPAIEKIASSAGALEPILADSTLLIRGSRLRGNVTKIRIGTLEVTPREISDTQLSFPLSSLPAGALRAGVQGVQVIHELNGTSSQPHRGVESNVAALVLRPTLLEINISELETETEELRSAQVTARINLTVGKAQRTTLLLNERSSDSPTAYLFDARKRETDTDAIAFSIYNVKPGEYLARIQIDGAESLLSVDADPESPTFEQYINPLLLIP